MARSKINRVHDQSDTLVVHRPQFPDKQEIHNFCKENDIAIAEINARSVYDAAQHVHSELEKRGLEKLIILGNKNQFPCLKFRWEKEIGHTDIIFSDPHRDGSLSIVVGRIYGSTETIIAHLECEYGDSNEAVVFDTAPHRSELPVQALEALGFHTFLTGGFTYVVRRMMERAEFILQYSDGTIHDRIHGDPKRWFGGRRPRTILDYNDVATVCFKYYPVCYAEACSTANFGPLLDAFLAQKTVYVGSTTSTYNNDSECDSWETCHFCDGYKYGFLDLLDSYKTIGEVKRNVDAGLISTLDLEDLKHYESLLNKKIRGPETVALLTTIQNILFGNPNRPTTVGAGEGQFDIVKIPVTVS
ncbi:MAG: hypothetical protein ACFFDT_20285 [Candidatus Hodarchaeota archaeon]